MKVAKEAPDLQEQRIEMLKSFFPEVVSDGSIDSEKLLTMLSGKVIEAGAERFSFSWAGKRNATQILQMPTRATLIPDKKGSVNFENTENLFIEGDNLEVMKLLYKAYFGSVKMIYIDPPYNTGKDFVYSDNYSDPLEAYLKITGQKDEAGNLLTTNVETGGRFHSSWLSMMYPRLFLARQLLADDGAIAVSIDDHEVHNLRLIMNEIFGEEHLVNVLIVRRRIKSLNMQFEQIKSLNQAFEYVLVYRKSERFAYANPFKKAGEDRQAGYWNSFWNNADRPTMRYDIDGIKITKGQWKWEKDRGLRALANYKKFMEEIGDESKLKEYWLANHETFHEVNGKEMEFIKPVGNTVKYWVTPSETTIMDSSMMDYYVNDDTSRSKYNFDTAKNVEFLKQLIRMICGPDGIVLDFFAGSCTTAHATLELNREDGGTRRFVMVQLQEPTPTDSIARKAGYMDIAKIGKERMRGVFAKMNELKQIKLLENDKPEDLGFKIFRLTESNYRSWKGIEQKTAEKYVEAMKSYIDPLKDGWKLEDVLYEILVKEGFRLTSTISKEEFNDNEVWSVTDDSSGRKIMISLDEKIKTSTIKNLGNAKDDLFVCRDSALDDTAAANLALSCRLKSI